jgi:hypothetical protein
MQTTWETDISQLLTELLAAQDELGAILAKKRTMLMESDHLGLANMLPQEEQLLAKMQACAKRREELLLRAKKDGLPSSNISALSKALPSVQQGELPERIAQANSHTRLLRNQSITNWIVIQRTLIHLSQMLEIIATGGRLQPTYGDGEPVNASGSLVDRAA